MTWLDLGLTPLGLGRERGNVRRRDFGDRRDVRDPWTARHGFTLGIVQFALPPFIPGLVAAAASAVRRTTA